MDTCPNGMFNVTGNGIASDHDSTSGVPKTMLQWCFVPTHNYDFVVTLLYN